MITKEQDIVFNKEEADALYRIFAGLTRTCYESAQVYETAKPKMKEVFEKILEWGDKNCDNIHG